MIPTLSLPRPDRRVRPSSPVLRDWWILAALCVGQVVLWGLAFGLTYRAPEIDSAEQFVWSFSLENGYWKHPPMPSWIMHALLEVFGASVALPFVATQVCVVTALALVWRLGCEFMSPRRALIGTALTSLVAYHNVGADSFNHSTALLPFQAATVLLFYLATRRRSLHLWALAGVFAGLSLLVKYVALMPIVGLLLYFALDRRLHNRSALLGLGVAVGACAVVILPHVLWLQAVQFLPFHYARSVARPLPGLWSGLQGVADFMATQVLRLLPMLLGLAFVTKLRPATTAEPTQARPPGRSLFFLWVAALSPLTLTIAFAAVTQTELQSRWGTNAFLYSGLVAMAWVGRGDSAAMLRRTLGFVVAAHVALSVGMTLARTVVADRLHFRTRANFPGDVLAAEATKVWKEHSDAPLRIVVSDIWLGGNIVANSRGRVAVLIDGHVFKSPWVDEKAVASCGALVLDDQTGDGNGPPANSPALDRLMAQASVTGVWNLPWAVSQRQATDGATGVVRWGIIEPQDPTHCPIR
ncbi:MAG: glycosyltransferase family 39 protein [Caldimonas sp.]